MALLLEPSLTRDLRGTLTPFDAGGLGNGRFIHAASRGDLYEAWCTVGYALTEIGPHYVARLFADPVTYVLRLVGDPENAAPHGITSSTGFKGAWAIEVQVHEPVPVDPYLRRLVFARRARVLGGAGDGVPVGWIANAVVPTADDVSEDEFAETIADAILAGA